MLVVVVVIVIMVIEVGYGASRTTEIVNLLII